MTRRAMSLLPIPAVLVCLAILDGETPPPRRIKVEHGGQVHLYRQLEIIRADRVLQAIDEDLKELSPRPIRLSYFFDGDDLLRTATGKLALGDYATWRAQFKSYQPTLPAAEVFIIGKAVSVRIRERADESEPAMAPRHFIWNEKENILLPVKAPAPTAGAVFFSAQGADFELLDLTLTEGGGVKAFFRVGRGGKAGNYGAYAADLAAVLGDKLRVKEVQVAVRSDCWFIDDQEFPIAYRFLPLAKLKEPPPEEKYLKSETGYGSWESKAAAGKPLAKRPGIETARSNVKRRPAAGR